MPSVDRNMLDPESDSSLFLGLGNASSFGRQCVCVMPELSSFIGEELAKEAAISKGRVKAHELRQQMKSSRSAVRIDHLCMCCPEGSAQNVPSPSSSSRERDRFPLPLDFDPRTPLSFKASPAQLQQLSRAVRRRILRKCQNAKWQREVLPP